MKSHDQRMHELLYSNEGRVEQCERICKLEDLVRDMWRDCICQSDDTCNTCVVECNVTEGCALERRITELGIEVWS